LKMSDSTLSYVSILQMNFHICWTAFWAFPKGLQRVWSYFRGCCPSHCWGWYIQPRKISKRALKTCQISSRWPQ
jgi:hypothetical protein